MEKGFEAMNHTAMHHNHTTSNLSSSTVGKFRFEVVCRLTAQCAVQPGLGKVYSQILLQSHTSAEFYLKVPHPGACLWGESGGREGGGGGGFDNTYSQLLLHCHISAKFHLKALYLACQGKGQQKGFVEREGRGFLQWAWEQRVDRRERGGAGWWWLGEEHRRTKTQYDPTACMII